MANTMKMRVVRADGYVEVKVIIQHPMETGQRRNPGTGEKIPAHFIHAISAAVNGRNLVTSRCGGGIARNPFFAFRLRDVKTGDRVTVSWEDTKGESGSADAVVG